LHFELSTKINSIKKLSCFRALLLLTVLLQLAVNLLSSLLGSWAEQLLSDWILPTAWQVNYSKKILIKILIKPVQIYKTNKSCVKPQSETNVKL
jgi:hypothetical protein